MSGISLNEDSSHFFYTRSNIDVGIDEVDSFIDQYANTQVKELLFNVNCMRTSYPSEVWEPIWHGYDPEGGLDQPFLAGIPMELRSRSEKWVSTAWKIAHAGIDVYQRWIDRSRRHGISPWISVRMNDLHNVDNEAHFIHGSLWRDHPEFRRVHHRFYGWPDRALDYLHEEVRAWHLALIREVLERYDADGIELDWMRFGYHIAPGYEAEGREVLTRFTREVRGMLDETGKRRGRRISLAARVPANPVTSYDLGLDGIGWAREGLIDYLIATPFWATIDTDLPVDYWLQALEGTGTMFGAGLEVLVQPYRGAKVHERNTLATTRGAAESVLSRGADRVYLFNYMDSETAILDISEYPALLKEVGELETLEGKPRRHIITYRDTYAPGEASGSLLPARLEKGNISSFRLHIGRAPDSRMSALIRIGLPGAHEGTCTVYLNGKPCSFAGVGVTEPPGPEDPVALYTVESDAMKPGYNIIDIAAHDKIEVSWLELAIL